MEAAIANALQLLERDPAAAARQAWELLKAAPGHPGAMLLLGAAANAQGDFAHAIGVLEPLVRGQPNSARAWLALGVSQAGAGRHAPALRSLERAVTLQPGLPGAWLALAGARRVTGDLDGANAACLQHLRHGRRDPQLMAASTALSAGRARDAEGLLRARLRRFPSDVAAMRMLAEAELLLGRNDAAVGLLRDALALAPGFGAARQNLVVALKRADCEDEAFAEIDALLREEPGNQALYGMKAVMLGEMGEFERAIEVYEGGLARLPGNAALRVGHANALKTAGRTEEAIAGYRAAITLAPETGSAWWSLANLKTVRFDAADIAAMEGQLQRQDLDDGQRLHLEFALGKALEDAGAHAASFARYASGNALRRRQLPYGAALAHARTLSVIRAQDRSFFAARAGSGSEAPDPIFVVGMPRSGSTLVEQILASHPQVEGTMELPAIIAMAHDLRLRGGAPETESYQDALAALGHDELRALGERYLERTRVQRKQGRPFFIDKMPNNFAHVGLIHLILPNAKIIDARRHPLACGFSNFKQHFARGQAFSYDLVDMGRYYADYVALMAHFDEVLPGRIHRVIYEEMVADTEVQVRALLDFCGLPFDERCLRFFENERAVRTASSEQVRQPIYREGLDQWRHYEPWLDPLKAALGPVLDHYPAVPPVGDLPV